MVEHTWVSKCGKLYHSNVLESGEFLCVAQHGNTRNVIKSKSTQWQLLESFPNYLSPVTTHTMKDSTNHEINTNGYLVPFMQPVCKSASLCSQLGIWRTPVSGPSQRPRRLSSRDLQGTYSYCPMLWFTGWGRKQETATAADSSGRGPTDSPAPTSQRLPTCYASQSKHP